MFRRTTAARAIAVSLCVGGMLVAWAGADLVRQNKPRRFPFRPWSSVDAVIWSVTVASIVLMLLSGTWLVFRLASNPTGWWVLAGGAISACWLAGSYWPGPLSPWADELLPTMSKAAIVMAVLPWPMGRLEARWARPFHRTVAAYVAIGCVSPFFEFHWPMWDTRRWRLPSTGGFADGLLLESAVAVLLTGLAPAVFLAAVVRRQAMMPESIRASTRPAVLGATLLAGSELWIFFTDVVAGSIEPTLAGVAPLTAMRSIVAAGTFGVMGVLLVLAEALRRRSARSLSTERHIELGPRPRGPTPVDVRSMLGDPSAQLLVRGVDDLGAPRGTRGRVEIVDRSGTLVAAVDHDPALQVSAAALAALLAGVELGVLRAARGAEARARSLELRRTQRTVLDAHDVARHRLERDLHDGVQQRMVALTIEASMAARREGTTRERWANRDALIASIESTIGLARDVTCERSPAVLQHGLAEGLVALESTVPIASTLEIEGDLGADHPATATLWFVACEAVANALKHSAATRIGLSLRVGADVAELVVADDGVGGALAPADSIRRRLDAPGAEVLVSSPPGAGTVVTVRVDVSEQAALA